MTFDLSQLNSDINNILSEIPITITIDSVDYTASKSLLSHDKIYTDYGFGDEYKFTVFINSSILSAIPENRSLVTIDSTEYRILDQTIDRAGYLIRLHLGNKYGKTN